MNFVNLTPHTVKLNDGRELESQGAARVASTHTAFDANGICGVEFGTITDLPDPVEGTTYIVSALVASAAKRHDVVSPATGHPETVRNDKGHIVSVPGFVRVI